MIEEEAPPSPAGTTTFTAFKQREKAFKHCATVREAVLEGGAIDLTDTCTVTGAGADDVWTTRRTHLWSSREPCVEYSFPSYPGVHVLHAALDRGQQVQLAYHALSACLAPPNTTNLHAHWDASRRQELDDIWQRDGPVLDTLHAKDRYALPRETTLSRVRWATLGYQYNWTARSYSKERFVPFPARLAAIAQSLAAACESKFDINAQAAIVNYYPEGQVMGGHQDDGEEALESPVVSMSIGSPCVFLLGGMTRDEEPIAVILRSGDVLVLGGNSRLRYHGVPKVWVNSEGGGPPDYLHPDTVDTSSVVHSSECPKFLLTGAGGKKSECSCGGVEQLEIKRTLRYLQSTRINLNLRQVFND